MTFFTKRCKPKKETKPDSPSPEPAWHKVTVEQAITRLHNKEWARLQKAIDLAA